MRAWHKESSREGRAAAGDEGPESAKDTNSSKRKGITHSVRASVQWNRARANTGNKTEKSIQIFVFLFCLDLKLIQN